MCEIITDLDKISDRSDEVNTLKTNKEIRDIILKLKHIIKEKQLTSLSAPQIGYNKRLFCINFNNDIRTFINPIITKAKGLQLSKETCSSIPDKTFIRPRNNDIDVMYQTPTGKPESRRLVGLAAIIFQHEIDHLDGILLTDIGLEIDSEFENASEEDKQQVINAYLESIDLKSKEIKNILSEDEESKRIYRSIEFMESVARGETQLLKDDEK